MYAENKIEFIKMGSVAISVFDPSGRGVYFNAGLLPAMRRDMETMAILKLGSAGVALEVTAPGCNYLKFTYFLKNNVINYSKGSVTNLYD